ncbi:MAG: SLC13 family permease [Chloroflexota bacterium]
MTIEIAITLAIILAAVVLFATEKLRVDIIALIVLLTVGLIGFIPPEDVFAGFASPAVVTVWAVYIVSAGLFKTGVADFLGERITRISGTNEIRLIVVIMVTCGIMSAFMNNIGATAVLLPVVVGISRKARIPLSKLLIPLSFASLMGGNMTLIGTPPNILATNILAARDLPTFNFFDFAPMGILVFATGIIYMVLVGRRILPARVSGEERMLEQQARDYVGEVRVGEESAIAGQSLLESRLGADYDLSVVAIVRDGEVRTALTRETYVEADDLLLVEGSVENLMQAQQDLGLAVEVGDSTDLEELDPERAHIVEATLAPRSSMVGRSLREIRFRDRFGFTALAIYRHGEVINKRLRDVKLEFGDALLLRGPRDLLPALQEGNEFLVLEPVYVEMRRRNKALLAVGIMALVLILATFAGVIISMSMVIGAVLMVLTGCLTMDEAYESIEWRSVFLIGGMLSLGIAMESTGTAQFLADGIVDALGRFGPMAILAGIYILAALITEPMSNAAATVLMVPIAIDVALSLGANPQTFALATVIGASTSFLTPVGHQANVLVFGPGGYRFFDFTRVGAPLNVALFLVTMIFLPILWPLFPGG